MRRLATICLFLVLGAACSNPPGSVDKYDEAVAANDRLSSDLKWDASRRPAEILRFVGIEPGMVVVDILAGSGYWSELASSLVGPEGRVYLYNNGAFLGRSSDRLEMRLEGDRKPNIERLDAELGDMGLPANADLAVLSLVYHDVLIEHDDKSVNVTRQSFMQQLRDALMDGGRVLLIDHAAPSGAPLSTADELHRVAEDFVINEFIDHGFRLIGTSNALRNPGDPQSLHAFNEELRQKTDRFVLLFEKLASDPAE